MVNWKPTNFDRAIDWRHWKKEEIIEDEVVNADDELLDVDGASPGDWTWSIVDDSIIQSKSKSKWKPANAKR